MGFILIISAWVARLLGIAFANPAAEAAIAQEAITLAQTPEAQALIKDVAANVSVVVSAVKAEGATAIVNPGLGHGGGSLMRGE